MWRKESRGGCFSHCNAAKQVVVAFRTVMLAQVWRGTNLRL